MLSLRMLNWKGLALLMAGLLTNSSPAALAQGDPNAGVWRQGWDMQVSDMMNSAEVVGKAIGCGIVSPLGGARQSIYVWADKLWGQGIRHGAVRPRSDSNTLDMSIFGKMDQKLRDGEASVKRPNGCDFWKSQPRMVYKLQQLDGQ